MLLFPYTNWSRTLIRLIALTMKRYMTFVSGKTTLACIKEFVNKTGIIDLVIYARKFRRKDMLKCARHGEFWPSGLLYFMSCHLEHIYFANRCRIVSPCSIVPFSKFPSIQNLNVTFISRKEAVDHIPSIESLARMTDTQLSVVFEFIIVFYSVMHRLFV